MHKVRVVTVAWNDIQFILQKKNLRGSDLPSQLKSQSWDLYLLSPPPRQCFLHYNNYSLGGIVL